MRQAATRVEDREYEIFQRAPSELYTGIDKMRIQILAGAMR